MQIIFFAEFGAQFVPKCAARISKIGSQLKKFCPKITLIREFQQQKTKEEGQPFSRKILKLAVFYYNHSKLSLNVTKYLDRIKPVSSSKNTA